MPNETARSLASVRWLWFFASLGAVAQVIQIVLFREFLTLAEGTELTVAFVLGMWLVLTALGSFLAGAWLKREHNQHAVLMAYTVLSLLLAISVAADLFILRYARSWLGAPPGEPLSLDQWALVATAALLLVSPLLGAQFVVAATLTGQPQRIYLVESVGAVIAGALLSLVLLSWLDHSSLLAAFLSLHLLCSAGVLLSQCLRPIRYGSAIGLGLTACLLLVFAPFVEHLTQQRFWQSLVPLNGTLRLATSPYGTLAVLHADGQYSAYQNGQLLFTLPDQGETAALVHLILLQHPKPSRVLVIGGFGGWVAAVLRHPTVTLVDWVELDPTLPQLLLPMLPQPDRQWANDPRLQLHHDDGRRFLQRVSQPYEVIFAVVADPTTAAHNRYYTREFFEAAMKRLTPGGLLALHGLREPPAGWGELFLARNCCVYATMRSVFCRVFALPSNPLTLLGRCPGPENYPLTLHEPTLQRRAQERRLTEPLHWFGLTDLVQVERVNFELEHGLPFNPLEREKTTAMPKQPLNTDANPRVYFLSSLLWLRHSSEVLAKGLATFVHLPWWAFGLGLVAAFTVTSLCFRVRQPQGFPLLTMAVIAATGMVVEVSILLAFQSHFGTLYQQVGLLFALFMLGLAFGAWVGQRFTTSQVALKRLLLLTIGITVAWWGAALSLTQLPPLVAFVLCAIAMLAIGGLVGAAFPLTTHALQLGGIALPHATGLAYAYDLVGGALGAFLLGAIVLPLYGTPVTLGLSALLCLLTAFLWERWG